MQMKSLFAHTSESEKPGFGITPEAFDSVDMAFAMDEFILSMVDPKVLFITKVNESIVTSPTIRMDNAFKAHTASDNRLQRGSPAIRDNFGIHFPVAFEDAKNNSFTESSTASFAFNPPSAKEAFINFNLSGKRRLPFTEFGNSFSNFREISVDSIPVKTGDLSNLRGIQIQ